MDKQLTHILPLVKKPIRYTGGEYNVYQRQIDKEPIYCCLIMPEIYEIGMSNYGLKILYSILNRKKNVIAERCYAPWCDFGKQLKIKKVPLYSLESKRPLNQFQILGFSLQSELSYPNVLYMLELSQIPLLNTDRNERHPLIIAGGPCTVNPLPLSTYFDLFVIGDGEEVILEIVEIYKNWNRQNRDTLLTDLSKLNGVYVPLIHNRENCLIKKRNVLKLKEEDFPYPPLVPICEIVHDRLTIEVSRGCTRGCRFCQAGYINRPLRIRQVDEIVRLAEQGIRSSGWEELSLLSLSTSDYPNLGSLIRILVSQMAKRRVAISLPSMRGEDFNPTLAQTLSSIKKTGLTFAPETSSPRLRSLINKDISEEKIIDSIKNAVEMGWRSIKLYFMIGLPNETDRDLEEMIYFMKQVAKISPRLHIKFNLSTFIPKSHTPLQWCQFEDKNQVKQKIEYLKTNLNKKNISAKWENADVSYIQAILARGDEKLAPVIYRVYQNNGIFQDWTENFNIRYWENAFAENKLTVNEYLQSQNVNEPLKWDFIDIGVDKDFLKNEYYKALQSEKSPNCYESCLQCGVSSCFLENKNKFTQTEVTNTYSLNEQSASKNQLSANNYKLTIDDLRMSKYRGSESFFLNKRYRVKYKVGETYRYAGHLDIVRAIYRTLRRSELPIAYSQGFSPHPIVSFGPPLPVGIISQAEYFDVEMIYSYNGNLLADLQCFMPHDLEILKAHQISRKDLSLGKLCNIAEYVIKDIPDSVDKNRLLEKKTIRGIYNLELFESNSLRVMVEIAPKVKLFDVLQELLGQSEQIVKCLNIERTNIFVRKDGNLKTPMEDE